jgi:putative oxidoreductase
MLNFKLGTPHPGPLPTGEREIKPRREGLRKQSRAAGVDLLGVHFPATRERYPMNPLTNFIALLARILLAILFVQGGYFKLMGGIPGTVTNMTNHGIPFPNILVWGAIAVELVGGLMLMAGLFARWVALVIAAYTLVLGLIFHAYWLAPAADMRFERIIFFNHLSIIGGMLAIVAFGAGCFSLDAAMGRKSA